MNLQHVVIHPPSSIEILSERHTSRAVVQSREATRLRQCTAGQEARDATRRASRNTERFACPWFRVTSSPILKSNCLRGIYPNRIKPRAHLLNSPVGGAAPTAG
jgi:hypothetical protein